MNYRRFLGAASAALMIVIVVTLMLAPGAWAQSKYNTLYKFKGKKDGSNPQASLILDPAGNLYGTTSGGGAHKRGTAFELTPSAGGGWTENVLYSFCSVKKFCWDGNTPTGGLIFDQAGDLYGTTSSGGFFQRGTAFELTPNPDGSWAEKLLYRFKGIVNGANDAASPESSLIFDPAGKLYGTTPYGGHGIGNQRNCNNNGCGAVFMLTPNLDGAWTESLLYNICSVTNCADGNLPLASVTLDQAGNLYGTTVYGGGCGLRGGCGVVFELTPNSDGTWKETVIHRFTGRGENGMWSEANLIFDGVGNLYGTTSGGGNISGCSNGGCGVVFELMPNGDGSWKEKVLHRFSGKDGNTPRAGLVRDQAGNLYGTTTYGGNLAACGLGCGVVFKLTPNSNGGWKETVVHRFAADSRASGSDMISDAAGNLYGTTVGDGTTTFGTVFEIRP